MADRDDLDRNDLARAVAAWQRSSELAPTDRPTVDDLLAFAADELVEPRATRVRELVARDPAAAALVDEALAMWAGDPPPDVAPLSREDVSRGWAAITAKIAEEAPGPPSAVPLAFVSPPPAAQRPSMTLPRRAPPKTTAWYAHPAAGWAVAAGLLIVLGATLLQTGSGRRPDGEDEIAEANPSVVFLRPTVEHLRGGGEPHQANRRSVDKPGSSGITFQLKLEDPDRFSGYEADIFLPNDSTRAWRRIKRLIPQGEDRGYLTLRVPQQNWQDGIYRLRVYGLLDGARTEVAEYECEVKRHEAAPSAGPGP